MAVVDRAANARKDRTDSLAADLLNIDPTPRLKNAKRIAQLVGTGARMVITGGAGSGKSSIACDLAELLDVPMFDFDEYVPGGFDKDSKVYRKRLLDAMDNLWGDLPSKGGWIIEHVEACNEYIVKAFRPQYALLVDPPAAKMLRTAAARSQVNNESEKTQLARVKRAMESAEYARMQYADVPGEKVEKGKGWELKKVKMG